MKKLLIVLAVVFLIYINLCMVVYFFQQSFIFHPEDGSQPPPDDLGIQEFWIPVNEQVELNAWWMPVDSNAYTVLFFHGNAGNISRGEKRMRLLREMGYNVLAIDYRGFGVSTGKIENEDDIYEDAQVSYDFLQKKFGIKEDKIIIWGWSLGGAVAVNLAQNKKCHALVMEATFNSMLEMANRTFWYIPNRLTLKFDFASGEKLCHVNCPILFIHSRTDKTVPFSQGEKLFANCRGKKKFIEISGDHNHGLFDSKESFIPQALPFLK